MRRALVLMALAGLVACEDGPEQVFTPNDGDPKAQNGYVPQAPWTPEGEKSFDYTGGEGDAVGRAQFCDKSVQEKVGQWMLTQPIVPDKAAGGIALWAANGLPASANDLLGVPADVQKPNKFCDPVATYLNGYSFGTGYEELTVIFNQDTKLIEAIQLYPGYLGTMESQYTDAQGAKVPVALKVFEKLTIGGVELDRYVPHDAEESDPNAWLNPTRVTQFYTSLRETFFGAAPFPADFDCIATKVCDIAYQSADHSTPQYTFVSFRDSGVMVIFTPTGEVYIVVIEPVKIAPFEVAATVSMLDETGKLAPKLASVSTPGCTLEVAAGMSWADFGTRCVDSSDTKTLARATYTVHAQRDGVDVSFNGVELSFLHPIALKEVLKDGEHPASADKLYRVNFTRSMSGATVTEFKPATLAALFKTRLEAKVRGMVPAEHPLATFELTVPADFVDEPQAIGALTTVVGGKPKSWLKDVVVPDLQARVAALTPEQRKPVEDLSIPAYVLEPFVDAVLYAFTGGASEAAGAFRGFETTDDQQWVIGLCSLTQDNVPYRLEVQYGLNYGAITSVTFEAGNSQVDELFDTLRQKYTRAIPYYGLEFSRLQGNPFGFQVADAGEKPEGYGISVNPAGDRRLNTIDVTLSMAVDAEGAPVPFKQWTVPGTTVVDQGGFYKQFGGERWEFIPAHVVQLYGKETKMVFYVTEDQDGNQQVARISQPLFKGKLDLCPGLKIAFGDFVQRKLEAWIALKGEQAYRDCDVVFNYSANGNVLQSIASLKNKVSFGVSDRRAVSASIWQ